MWTESQYQYLVLPMGLTCSPRIFTAVARFIATEVRKLGVLAIFYLDDILVLGGDKGDCQKSVDRLLAILKARGFVINYKKSDLNPNTEFTYLGHVWQTRDMKVGLKPSREIKLRRTATSIIAKKKINGKLASQFIGQVMSTLLSVPLAKARIRTFQ